MATAIVTETVTTLGKTFTQRRTVTADGDVTKDPTLAAAKTGVMTTKTDANTGVATMTAGHGLATSDRVDVYWSGGARYGMIATVAVNAVTIDGGGGDDLPATSTALTVMKPQLENFPVNTADLQSLLVGSTVPMWAVFLDDADALVKAIYVGSSTDAYKWDVSQVTTIEATNPFSLGDVASVYLSHGSSVGSKQVSAVALVN